MIFPKFMLPYPGLVLVYIHHNLRKSVQESFRWISFLASLYRVEFSFCLWRDAEVLRLRGKKCLHRVLFVICDARKLWGSRSHLKPILKWVLFGLKGMQGCWVSFIPALNNYFASFYSVYVKVQAGNVGEIELWIFLLPIEVSPLGFLGPQLVFASGSLGVLVLLHYICWQWLLIHSHRYVSHHVLVAQARARTQREGVNLIISALTRKVSYGMFRSCLPYIRDAQAWVVPGWKCPNLFPNKLSLIEPDISRSIFLASKKSIIIFVRQRIHAWLYFYVKSVKFEAWALLVKLRLNRSIYWAKTSAKD